MMQARVRGLEASEAAVALEYMQRSFPLALDRFGHTLREVDVTISDVNGPRGGADKRCRVQLRFQPKGLLVVRSVGSSLYEVVQDACAKARRVIEKRFSRLRRIDRERHKEHRE